MSTRKRLSNIAKQALKRRFAEVETAIGLGGQIEYFGEWENRNHPLFMESGFDADEAWWLSELCHLVYTPDSKEFARVWNTSKPDRLAILDDRTPFRELLDVHKTGHHASIYEMGTEGTVLCFRGTSKPTQWISNLVFHPHEWDRYKISDEGTGSFVHSGFYLGFKRLWPLIWPTLRLSPRPWIFTGHSLGGAMAMLANAVVKADKTYTFGAPRVGNEAFVNTYLDETIRIVNNLDIVPLLPAREQAKGTKQFSHGGELILLTGDGGIHPEPASHHENEAWAILDAWSRATDSEEMMKHRPVWIKDHLIGSYCDKIARIGSEPSSTS